MLSMVDETLDDSEDSAPAPAKRPVRTRSAFVIDREEPEYSDTERQELEALYEKSFQDFEEGEIVRGRVLEITSTEVLVDVGFKSEGVIPADEFPSLEGIKPGDEIEVFLEKMENQDGLVVLSKQRADFVKVWDRVKEAADAGTVVEGRLLRKIKGGVVADLYGVEAFLPGSQISIRQVHNLDDLFNQTLRFKIIKLNKRRRNIVVSRRAVLEEEREKMKKDLLTELEKGQIREGTVKNITDFGAFVDLGGIDGLLHITDMSWGRVSHPSEVVRIGERLKVKVLNFDRERERISLGLKQLQPYPWEGVAEKYPVGTRLRGKVVSITDYGAFVEIEQGVEGLVHVSEMSWTRHVRHPSKVVNPGDEVEAVVLKVDKEHEKISLGMKQIEPDPWSTLDLKYPPGTRLRGKVRNLTNFGAFVEIEEGIDGLVHVSDMSWTKRVMHPSEVLKKGDEIDVVVLKIDRDERRVSLGLKHTMADPWAEMADHFPPDHQVKGTVKRLLDKGVVVDMGDEIEGFVPISQLGVDNLTKPSDGFKVGDELPLTVIRVDPDQHRIVLSVRRYLEMGDEEAAREFQSRFGGRRAAAPDEAEAPVTEPEPAPEPIAGEAKSGKRKKKVKDGSAADQAEAEAMAAAEAELRRLGKQSAVGEEDEEE
jgi:small subunit ribosomal protein S1